MQARSEGRERRRVQRVGFRTQAVLTLATGTLGVQVLDLSLAGAMFRADAAPWLEPGDQSTLRISLGDDVQIEMSGAILAHGNGLFALRRRVGDKDNERHLRRLLELNLGDAERVERDIEAMTPTRS